MTLMTMAEAENKAFDEELARDETVFIRGEDIGEHWGGPFGQFKGLAEKYGTERIRETPISETAILGGAIGAAATGMRPIAYLMFADFFGVAGDDFLNQLQMRYMYGGKVKLPLTIVAGTGAGHSAAAQHSKTMYGWLATIQGLKVVAPSTPRDAKGLLKSAIRDDNPVVYLSHKMVSYIPNEVEDEEFTIPLGKADIKREGTDVTVVATANCVPLALQSAGPLQEQGVSIEIIDPRTLVPLDKEAIYKSLEKTGRLVVMSEEPRTGSWAGEVAALVAEEAFDLLDAPIKRVCAPDTPIPSAPVLEKYWAPDAVNLITAVRELV